MNWMQWVLVVNLALSGLVIFARGCKGSTRVYTMWDGTAGLVECAVMVWLVVSL